MHRGSSFLLPDILDDGGVNDIAHLLLHAEFSEPVGTCVRVANIFQLGPVLVADGFDIDQAIYPGYHSYHHHTLL